MTALVILILVVAAGVYVYRKQRKDHGTKPPAWTNPTVPPADRPDPPGKDKL